MKALSTLLTLSAATLLVVGCATRKQAPDNEAVVAETPVPSLKPLPTIHKPLVGERNALPAAVIYKTNGDYADNVPVSLNASSTALLSFPAPGDLTATSTPLPVADGFLLDRRGLGANTAFTRYTYQQYAALAQAPDTAAIMRSIIPGAKVTVRFTLPFTLNEALADTTLVNDYIRRNLTR